MLVGNERRAGIRRLKTARTKGDNGRGVLQGRLFQQKLGVAVGAQAARELALLGGIRIVNKYHFSDVGLPVSGHLKMGSAGRAAEAVARANAHVPELVVKLEEFREYLRTRTSYFFEAEASVSRYLAVLTRNTED